MADINGAAGCMTSRVVRDGFDGEQSFVPEATDYRRIGTRSGELENPLLGDLAEEPEGEEAYLS